MAELQTEGCTQTLKLLEFDHFKLIDTPGLNDPNMTTNEWQTRYNEWVASHETEIQVDLAVLVFKQSIRPSVADANSLAVLREALSSCDAANVVIVFTFCDEINPNKKKGGVIDKDYLSRWYN